MSFRLDQTSICLEILETIKSPIALSDSELEKAKNCIEGSILEKNVFTIYSLVIKLHASKIENDLIFPSIHPSPPTASSDTQGDRGIGFVFSCSIVSQLFPKPKYKLNRACCSSVRLWFLIGYDLF